MWPLFKFSFIDVKYSMLLICLVYIVSGYLFLACLFICSTI